MISEKLKITVDPEIFGSLELQFPPFGDYPLKSKTHEFYPDLPPIIIINRGDFSRRVILDGQTVGVLTGLSGSQTFDVCLMEDDNNPYPIQTLPQERRINIFDTHGKFAGLTLTFEPMEIPDM